MATRKQRAANRRNAQLSTGPKTPEGKAAVRLNALKHGLVSEDAVIFVENEEAFNELRDTFLDHLQPAGPLETALVHQMVVAQWRLARCRGIETGLFELRLADEEKDLDSKEYVNLLCHQQLAQVFHKNTDPLAMLGRYEARIERSFFRALHELQRLQAARQPPDKTNSAEQTQIAPETEPSPLPQNDLTPADPINAIGEIARATGSRSSSPGKLLSMKPGFAASPSHHSIASASGHAESPAALPVGKQAPAPSVEESRIGGSEILADFRGADTHGCLDRKSVV
jgi:hypothetical protein